MPRTRAGPVVNSSTSRISESLPGMHQLAQAQRQRRFEAGDAEGRAVEFNVLARGMMRSVVGGDRVDAAVGEACDQRVAVVARGQRRIHFVMRVVADVFVGQREMVRRDFAGDAKVPSSSRTARIRASRARTCARCAAARR